MAGFPMKVWISARWEMLRESFWFVPSLTVAAAIVLSLLTIHLDRNAAERNWAAVVGWTFARGPEGSRALLATVAGSMVTISSVTFSITIVALQLASSQFGPRLLRNFMRDRGNQIAIGTFIATFTYCILVLRTVNGTNSEQFVPHISVTVGLILALVSLAVLIYFIHHAAESIQAENVITAVSKELLSAIDRLYPDRIGEKPPASRTDPPADGVVPEDFDSWARAIPSPRSDYLQAIDGERLMQIARDNDLILKVPSRPGKFVVEGDALAKAWPVDRVSEKTANAIRGLFYFGTRRTLVQDVEFGIDQLVEVAVRALSPGINDPFTAINCIDRLGAALCVVSEPRHSLRVSLRPRRKTSRDRRRIDGFGRHRRGLRSNTPGGP